MSHRYGRYTFGGKQGAKSLIKMGYICKFYSKSFIKRATGVTSREYNTIKKETDRERTIFSIKKLAKRLIYGSAILGMAYWLPSTIWNW